MILVRYFSELLQVCQRDFLEIFFPILSEITKKILNFKKSNTIPANKSQKGITFGAVEQHGRARKAKSRKKSNFGFY